MNGEEWMSEKWSDEEEKKEEGSRNKYYKKNSWVGPQHTHTRHKTFVESSESAADDERRRRWMIYKVKKEVGMQRQRSTFHAPNMLIMDTIETF